MSTTAILVEILIIGIQTLIWVSALIFTYLVNLEKVLGYFKEATSISILLGISIAYTLGIIFDYVIPATLKKIQNKIDNRNNVRKNKKFMVIDILDYSPELHKYLDSQASRLKIARATVFNVPLISVSLILSVLGKDFFISIDSIIYIIVILVFGFLFTKASYNSWSKRRKVYMNYIKRAYEIVEKHRK